MELKVLVINGNKKDLHNICKELHREHIQTVAISSSAELNTVWGSQAFQAAILDLDSMPVNNQLIKDISRQNLSRPIIGLSIRSYHPELKEAISKHMYACIQKPIDFDELLFWIKSIYENHTKRREHE